MQKQIKKGSEFVEGPAREEAKRRDATSQQERNKTVRCME